MTFSGMETSRLWHILYQLQWHHNGGDGGSNRQPRDCLLNRLLRRRSNITSKLRVTGLCEGNSPMTGEFPAQRASNAENVSIWWRHHFAYHSVTFTKCQRWFKSWLGAEQVSSSLNESWSKPATHICVTRLRTVNSSRYLKPRTLA